MRLVSELKVLFGSVVLSGAMLVSAQARAGEPAAQQPAAPAEVKGGKKDPMAAMQAAMEAAMTPGPEHEKLKGMAGTWSWAGKFWMAPGAPPDESSGQSEFKSVLGGRFLEEVSTGTVMKQPFEGHGTVGYDNTKKKYVMSWADNMGTMIMTGEGTLDASGKKLTMSSEFVDPMTRKKKTVQMIRTSDSDTKFMLEMMDKVGGKPFKVMELTYTKK
ncbi:MAG: DUF1579 domain-containing protein [Deltaproteobacteria bacterium]|nr:DUF1579 domain-containing protein [Deltaproteobacteria bacterium]